jgi:hypothetical protein
MNNSITLIEKLNKTELSDLLIELFNIGNVDKPAYVRKSETLSLLFNAENSEYYTWSDKFSNVRRYVELEILCRIRKNIW